MHGFVRRLADVGAAPWTRNASCRFRRSDGPMRARLYEPAHDRRRTVLLVSGLHPAGIDESRLVSLARQLAASHLAVVTPDIRELSELITASITDGIEWSAVWLASSPDLAPDGRVGLMGISFSGGLAVVAAGRPSLAGHVAYVLSFGGHDDLPRVLRFLCTGTEPEPRRQIRLLERCAGRRRPCGRTITAWQSFCSAWRIASRRRRKSPCCAARCTASSGRRTSTASIGRKPTASLAALRELAKHLPEPFGDAALLRYVNDRDVVHLGARLLPWISLYGDSPALSPSRSPLPSAPVYLLHGVDDNVIPAVESEYLADDLRGHTSVRLLLSGLISHAEADQPVHVGDVAQAR